MRVHQPADRQQRACSLRPARAAAASEPLTLLLDLTYAKTGTNWHFHFERGDAGWISAFERANEFSIHRIYFPRGTYWFGNNSTTVDLALYPRLWDGTALDVYGDGDYLVHFLSWEPIVGPMLDLSASKTFAR